MSWVWYAVALLLPAVLVLAAGLVTIALGGSAPSLARLTWSGMLLVFAVRLGSVLLTLLSHNSQGTLTVGSFGFMRPM